MAESSAAERSTTTAERETVDVAGCPHRQMVRNGFMLCELAARLGMESLPAPGRPACPCQACVREFGRFPVAGEMPETLNARARLLRPDLTPQVVNGQPVAAPTPEAKKAPSAMDYGRRFVASMRKWQAAGFPIVSREIRRQRVALCKQCKYVRWWGCSHSGCGCTWGKLALATETCPRGIEDGGPAWLAIVEPPDSKTSG